MKRNPLRMKRAIIDLASVVWTALSAGEDVEHGTRYDTGEVLKRGPNAGQKKIVTIPSAGYGYANALNHLKLVMRELNLTPHQMIFVKEGANSKAERQFIYAGYKAGRDHYPGAYDSYNEAVEMVCTTFLQLGARVVWQDGVEGDDVIGYLVTKFQGERWVVGGMRTPVFDDVHPADDDTIFSVMERWAVSGDKDLAALIAPDKGMNYFRRGEINTNPFGRFPVQYIPLYISLVGDSADKIPGAVGFGETAWANLRAKFGDESLPVFDHLVRTRQLEKLLEPDPRTGLSDVDELKPLKKVVDQANSVYMSYELACLKIDSVNTKRCPLQWRVGVCLPESKLTYRDLDLAQHAASRYLVHADNYDQMLNFLKSFAPVTPFFAFDIETSTSEESDEWVRAQPKGEGKDGDLMVDVMGSEYTGFSITFGPNMQYTMYVAVDHNGADGLKNVTKEQAKGMIRTLDPNKITFVHNASFELPVTLNNLGDMRHGNVPA